MCGRYTLRTPWQRLAEHFNLRVTDLPELFQPRYNVAPTQSVMSVGPNREGQPAPAFFRWGLVPAWASDPKAGPINARAETAASKPTFSEALQKRRCLIVADGFFEWKRVQSGKQPWYFRVRDGEPFAFAGLWEAWRPPEGGKPLLTCAMLTVAPNEVVKPVHNRMPAILRLEDYAAWSDRAVTDARKVLSLVRPYDPAEMTAFAVSHHVNNPKNDDAECVAPAPA
jgi:putative SOS response-associated peptidase YedK